MFFILALNLLKPLLVRFWQISLNMMWSTKLFSRNKFYNKVHSALVKLKILCPDLIDWELLACELHECMFFFQLEVDLIWFSYQKKGLQLKENQFCILTDDQTQNDQNYGCRNCPHGSVHSSIFVLRCQQGVFLVMNQKKGTDQNINESNLSKDILCVQLGEVQLSL